MTDLSVRITTLDNGLVVATDTMPQVETATIGLWTRVGARFENAANNGAAHFLEHMVFKGTKTRSALQIAQEVEDVGGYINAYTGREMTAYYTRVMKQDVGIGLDIVQDVILNPAFLADEMERERGVIIQEIGMYNDMPDYMASHHAQVAAFPDHPLGASILGPIENIQNMSVDTLKNFMATYYVPNNLLLCAAGHVDHDWLVQQANHYFGKLHPADVPQALKAVYQGGEVKINKDVEQVNVVVAFESPNYLHPDYHASLILASVLGDGMSSRLFQEIREKRGLVYGVGAGLDPYRDSGLWCVQAGTGAEQLNELMPVLWHELNNAVGTFTPAEIARAKAQTRAQTAMALESSYRRCDRLAHDLVYFGRARSNAEVMASIDAVSADDLDRVAKQIFGSKPTVSLYGPLG